MVIVILVRRSVSKRSLGIRRGSLREFLRLALYDIQLYVAAQQLLILKPYKRLLKTFTRTLTWILPTQSTKMNRTARTKQSLVAVAIINLAPRFPTAPVVGPLLMVTSREPVQSTGYPHPLTLPIHHKLIIITWPPTPSFPSASKPPSPSPFTSSRRASSLTRPTTQTQHWALQYSWPCSSTTSPKASPWLYLSISLWVVDGKPCSGAHCLEA